MSGSLQRYEVQCTRPPCPSLGLSSEGLQSSLVAPQEAKAEAHGNSSVLKHNSWEGDTKFEEKNHQTRMEGCNIG